MRHDTVGVRTRCHDAATALCRADGDDAATTHCVEAFSVVACRAHETRLHVHLRGALAGDGLGAVRVGTQRGDAATCHVNSGLPIGDGHDAAPFDTRGRRIDLGKPVGHHSHVVGARGRSSKNTLCAHHHGRVVQDEALDRGVRVIEDAIGVGFERAGDRYRCRAALVGRVHQRGSSKRHRTNHQGLCARHATADLAALARRARRFRRDHPLTRTAIPNDTMYLVHDPAFFVALHANNGVRMVWLIAGQASTRPLDRAMVNWLFLHALHPARR
ncbi:hypothetical protein Y695_01798 [Hydrogenophaga sp. T4]|nr:hypothetical protein Y695_01798 [Hydrogenophaga sp. T4]